MCKYCKEDFDGYYKTLDKNGHLCIFDNPHEKTLEVNWFGKKKSIYKLLPNVWKKIERGIRYGKYI